MRGRRKLSEEQKYEIYEVGRQVIMIILALIMFYFCFFKPIFS